MPDHQANKRRENSPFACGASKNWSDFTIADCPTVHVLHEHTDKEAMLLIAKTLPGQEYLPNKANGEPRTGIMCQTVGFIARAYVENTTPKPLAKGEAPCETPDDVRVEYQRDPTGQMLFEESILKDSRLHASSDKMQLSFSISHLPKPIRVVALCRTHRQCDDSQCFHRSIMGMIPNPQALAMSG